MKRIIETFSCVLIFVVSACAANYTVKSDGSGNYTTIQACAAAMAPGDTCTVYAGTYSENVTVSAGQPNSYKTLNVNGTDVVNVYAFASVGSHVKIVGFHIGNPSAPSANHCVYIANSSTDVYITNNVMQSCATGMISSEGTQAANALSYIYIQGNMLSYACGRPTAPNNGVAIYTNGNHFLIENNDFSHVLFGVSHAATYSVFRNNTMHDMYVTENGSCSGNGHLDSMFAERGVQFNPIAYNLWEGNSTITELGANSKGYFPAADATTGGCNSGSIRCLQVIGRFNTFAHIGSSTMDSSSGFVGVKYYNNTIVDPNISYLGSNGYPTGITYQNSYGGAYINNLFYYPESVPSSWGWWAYEVVNDGSQNGFTAGGNIAWCTSTPCSFQARGGGGSFTTESPVTVANRIIDPQFVNYANNNFHLQSGSPAIATGSYLTTASGSGSSSRSLVVDDAGFFQDGLGLNAAGVQADCIAVTTASNHVCITAVNYSTNTLTLANPISWTSGDPVYLYSKSDGTHVLTGSAPDIGAYTGTSTSSPGPPTNLSAFVN